MRKSYFANKNKISSLILLESNHSQKCHFSTLFNKVAEKLTKSRMAILKSPEMFTSDGCKIFFFKFHFIRGKKKCEWTATQNAECHQHDCKRCARFFKIINPQHAVISCSCERAAMRCHETSPRGISSRAITSVHTLRDAFNNKFIK